jgi:HPt (histidine-containing phosphotransfer) domain-containing protein
VIDWDRIQELQDEVGLEDFEEIVTLFLEEVDAATAQLSAEVAPAKLADDLHFVKGCALNLGFAALGELCARGEQAAREGHAQGVCVAEVVQVYQSSRAALLEQRASASI